MLIIYYINKIMFVFKYQPMHQGRKNEDNHNVICRQYDCGPRLSKVNWDVETIKKIFEVTK